MKNRNIWLALTSIVVISSLITSCTQMVTTEENRTIQEGNTFEMRGIQNFKSSEITDNRIGGQWNGLSSLGGINTILSEEVVKVGLKRVRVAVNSCDVGHVDWDLPEFEIEKKYDN